MYPVKNSSLTSFSSSSSSLKIEQSSKLLAESESDRTIGGRYTLQKIKSGELSVEQAKINLATMNADLRKRRLTELEGAVALHPFVRDVIVSGRSTVEDVFRSRFYSDHLSNLNNTDVQNFILTNHLTVAEALELTASDLVSLADPKIQKEIVDSGQGAWLYFV